MSSSIYDIDALTIESVKRSLETSPPAVPTPQVSTPETLELLKETRTRGNRHKIVIDAAGIRQPTFSNLLSDLREFRLLGWIVARDPATGLANIARVICGTRDVRSQFRPAEPEDLTRLKAAFEKFGYGTLSSRRLRSAIDTHLRDWTTDDLSEWSEAFLERRHWGA